MAGTKIIRTKVRASSILEVIIAMVVIMVVFGIAMMIYINVTRVSMSAQKIRAEAILNETMLQLENTNGANTESFTADNFRIEQEVKAYNDDKDLLEIDLTAYDANQKKLTELHKVVINRNE